jgi:CRP/FNR family transcriptional regulator, cyclic AMP receptor protein
MGPFRKPAPDPSAFLAPADLAKFTVHFEKGQFVYTQGDPADCVFYIQEGAIKLTVVSQQGKEAVVGLLKAGDFFGEGCITCQPVRMGTASAISHTSLLRMGSKEIMNLLHKDPEFSSHFISYLVSHISKVEEDLVDQLFNSTEKRLARALLLLAHYGQEAQSETMIPLVSQETLAELIGTSRSRVNIFMNKFRKLGLIDYDEHGWHVHSSLRNMVLHDQVPRPERPERSPRQPRTLLSACVATAGGVRSRSAR